MSKIEVFEPALCCATGVCGEDVDQALVTFSADMDFIRSSGGDVTRYNLASEPQAFADNDSAKAFLHLSGSAGLPLIGVIDISERVRAQAQLERVQADFAHAARVSMLGELTASLAHEVNQPLAAIATNAAAGLRWLGRPEPHVGEVRATTERIAADARRAADIIARVRGMAERRTPQPILLSLAAWCWRRRRWTKSWSNGGPRWV